MNQIKKGDQIMNMLKKVCQEHAGLSSSGSQERLIARPQSKLEVCCCWWMCRAFITGLSERIERDCEFVYIGETSRTIEKYLSEHKNAVKKHDSNNGIAAHAWTSQQQVDWKAAKTRETEGNYWRRRVLEALHIHQQQHTSNLDCGLAILPGYHCLTNLHALDTLFSNIFIISSPFKFDSRHLNFIHIFPANFMTALDTTCYYLESRSAKFCKQLKKIYGSKRPVP